MGSETEFKLPVIDFSEEKLKAGSEEWESIKSQVVKALEEYGCFEAFFNKAPSDLKKGLIGSIEELMRLPLQTKQKLVSEKQLHGYIGNYAPAPLYQSMNIDDAHVPQNMESLTSALWPQGNPSFSKTVQSFSEIVAELDQIIRRMVVESLGVEKYMEEHMKSSYNVLRVMKYEAPQTQDTKLGFPFHTDKNFVSILCQNEIDGLEIQMKTGELIRLKLSPDSIVVMIGDCFHAWTNGRLHAPHHRVMMRGNEPRYSAGWFSVPKAGYFIEALEELVDEQHPLLFKRFEREEFVAFAYSEAGRACQSPLHTYCGL